MGLVGMVALGPLAKAAVPEPVAAAFLSRRSLVRRRMSVVSLLFGKEGRGGGGSLDWPNPWFNRPCYVQVRLRLFCGTAGWGPPDSAPIDPGLPWGRAYGPFSVDGRFAWRC